LEKSALDRAQYDTAISLLDNRVPGGRRAVRRQLVEALKPNLARRNALNTHRALLILSRMHSGQCRLITTNFDRLFEEVIGRDKLAIQTYKAPLLPVPKARWDGLIYLHGLLSAEPSDGELNDLVISSGDFGLAYLTERWAARFVTELFRSYIVCFVGYSINDPVMRYVMDALAADRLLGEKPPEVFAFAGYSGKPEETEDEWGAKNVTPILYRSTPSHSYLHRTLRAWAELYRDGITGKERIIAQDATIEPRPSTAQDDVIGRVLWSLSDATGLPAERFSKLDPVRSLAWLDAFTDGRFGHNDLGRFGVNARPEKDDRLSFSLFARPTPYMRAPLMRLVQSGRSDSQWDDVMLHLARWLVRHLDDPKLIYWVAKQGGHLHPTFRLLIAERLSKHPVSPSVQKLWRLILAGRTRRSR
jgi:hypothetical protein